MIRISIFELAEKLLEKDEGVIESFGEIKAAELLEFLGLVKIKGKKYFVTELGKRFREL